jgi:hypothetical protein
VNGFIFFWVFKNWVFRDWVVNTVAAGILSIFARVFCCDAIFRYCR